MRSYCIMSFDVFETSGFGEMMLKSTESKW